MTSKIKIEKNLVEKSYKNRKDWKKRTRGSCEAEASQQGSRSKQQGSWTLLWHKWAFQKGYGRDIKTVQIKESIFYHFIQVLELKQAQNNHFRPTYEFYMNCYGKPFFSEFLFCSGHHLVMFQASKIIFRCRNIAFRSLKVLK